MKFRDDREVRPIAGSAGKVNVGRLSSTPRNLDTLHVDHTQLDALVCWGPAAHQVCERIWLTAVFCPRSRCVLGYSISLEPSGDGVVALSDVFDRHGRLPDRFVVDRGTEFGSVAFEQLGAAAGMETLHPRPGPLRWGSTR